MLSGRPEIKVIQTDDFVSFLQKMVANVRGQKARCHRDDRSTHPNLPKSRNEKALSHAPDNGHKSIDHMELVGITVLELTDHP